MHGVAHIRRGEMWKAAKNPRRNVAKTFKRFGCFACFVVRRVRVPYCTKLNDSSPRSAQMNMILLVIVRICLAAHFARLVSVFRAKLLTCTLGDLPVCQSRHLCNCYTQSVPAHTISNSSFECHSENV